MKRYLTICLCLIGLWAKSQSIQQQHAAEILLALKKLHTMGSVLYIAAHPDDENTRLLAYFSKERNLRTGYLSLTRGDGGQNLIGKEQGEALGLLRTQELLAARRIDGAEQFFTRANDFGYSKNPEETFSIWNKDSVLADMVWVIRQFKPDILICRFPTTGEGGHGHHTASALLTLEAFEAAADPKKFPEQLIYTQTWQAKRVFWNTFNFGGTSTTPFTPDQLKLDVGTYNPLLGKSYGEIAAESRSMHKSQGFGSAKMRGELTEAFKLLKGDSVKNDLFEGINQNWSRFPETEKAEKILLDCIKNFDLQAPEKSIPALISFYNTLQHSAENNADYAYWKKRKLKETEQLLIQCSGLWIEALASDYRAVPGTDINLQTHVCNRSSVQVRINSISFFNQHDTTIGKTLKQNELWNTKHTEKIADKIPFSNPFWLQEPHSIGMYHVKNRWLIGNAVNEAALKVSFNINLAGINLLIERAVQYKYTDPVKGEIYRPLELLPPATINISNQVFLFNSVEGKTIHFNVIANRDHVIGKLHINVPTGWSCQVKNPEFSLESKGDEINIEATLYPDKNHPDGKLQAILEINGNNYSKSIRRIEYDHIPFQFMLNEAEAHLVFMDLKTGRKNIGYIPGAGDEIPACLKQFGYDITLLNDELLSKENLSQFDCIISGIRAYNVNERLQTHYNKLMDYIKNGGNLVVQYNTNNRIGPVGTKIGPYPFTISRERVTDDQAEVRFLLPHHSALNYPNSITQKDFEGWVQERGIYFASELDKNYEPLFSMNDPKEKPNEGSLIIGQYGKGNFVYTGLAFFRELPAGVSGAFRLFVNLMSLPGHK